VSDSQEAREFVALVETLEAESLIELTLCVLISHVHDRV
jgi:hypothetical protein